MLKSSHQLFPEDLDCDLLGESYVKATTIVCRTRPVHDNADESFLFSVYAQTNVNYPQSVHSSLNASHPFVFEYVRPRVLSIEPRKGIKSGGTVLTITGHHLACGSELKFSLDESPCLLLNVSRRQDVDVAYCRTSVAPTQTFNLGLPQPKHQPQARAVVSYLSMKMDEFSIRLNHSSLFAFEFVDDPRVVSMEPSETIVSGGLALRVHGRGFATLQTVHLIVTADIASAAFFRSECRVQSDSFVECMIPQIRDKAAVTATSSSSLPLEYSIFVQLNELSSKLNDPQRLLVYPDPVFDEAQLFSDKTPIILIKGENLLRGVRESDYKVWIGLNVECNITSITTNFIACLLPERFLGGEQQGRIG